MKPQPVAVPDVYVLLKEPATNAVKVCIVDIFMKRNLLLEEPGVKCTGLFAIKTRK